MTTRHVLAAIFIVAGMVAMVPTMVEASPGVRLTNCSAAPARPLSSSDGHHLGIIYPRAVGSCVGSVRAVANDNESLYGSKKPQLKINGGEVMGTSAQPGAVTLIPVTWVPKSSSMASDYQAGFASFDAAVAADSAKPTNVFAIGTQYTDVRGRRLLNQFTAAEPIVDSAAYPAARLSGGCTVDTGPVYGDGTGYTACLTDVQIATELARCRGVLRAEEHGPRGKLHPQPGDNQCLFRVLRLSLDRDWGVRSDRSDVHRDPLRHLELTSGVLMRGTGRVSIGELGPRHRLVDLLPRGG